MNNLDYYVSRAEITYKSGRFASSIYWAKRALRLCRNESTQTALRIFIARVHAKLGKYSESNRLYRELINEKVYLPPVIMGLLYNSIKLNENIPKAHRNLKLIKLYVR